MTSRSRILTVLSAVSAAQLLVVSSAYADQTTGILTGRVTDAKTGKPLGDVAVVVTANSLQGEQSVTTDSSGYYRIPGLPAGVYNVQMFRGAYKPLDRTGVRLSAGQSIKINGTLVPEGEDIDVEVEAPQIDTGSSQTGVSLGQEFLKRVPLVAPTGGSGGAVRSFEAVAKAAPGARDDTYGASLGGASSPENNFIVNGVNTANTALGTNGSPLSIEFMEEVQIITGSYMPEYGLNTGGTISATIKRGSNEFHGHAWASYAPGALVGNPKLVQRNTSSIRTKSQLDWVGDIGVDLGGPIIKDKLWFYTGVMLGKTSVNLHRELLEFDINRNDSTEPFDEDGNGTIEEDEQEVKVTRLSYDTDANGQYIAKPIRNTKRVYKARGSVIQALINLTYGINKDNKLDLTFSALPRFAGGDNFFPANANNGTAVSALNGNVNALARKTVNLPLDASLRWTADADNKRWNFEQAIGWHHETTNQFANDGKQLMQGGLARVPAVVWRRTPNYHGVEDFESNAPDACERQTTNGSPAGLSTCPVDTYNTGGPGVLPNTKQDSIQLRQTTTRIAKLAGHHEIKFGANYSYNLFDNQKGMSGGAIYRETRSGALMQMFRGYGYLNGADEAVYLPQLTFTTKLHTARAFIQDSWAIMDKITINAGLLYDSQVVIGGLGDTTLRLVKQFSPRLGFVWDPTQKGRAKIRGAFGRYYQTINLQLADRAGTPEPGLQAFWASPGGVNAACGDWRERDSQCKDFGTLVNGNGLITTYPGGRFAGIGTTKTPIDRNIRAPAKDELALGGDWEFIPGYVVGADFTWNYIVRGMEDMSRDEGNTYFIGNPGEGIAKDFPKVKRDYKAFTLRFDKKMAKHWMATANYTLTFMEGNYGGLFRPETGQLDPNITSDFDLISLLANRMGALDGDIRHNIKVFAGGDIPIGERWYIDLGGAFTARSGGPTNTLGSHALYGDNESFLLPRGSGKRLPWVFNLNVNGGVAFAFGKSSRIGLAISAYNVLNLQQTTAVDNLYTKEPTVMPQSSQSALNKELVRAHEALTGAESSVKAAKDALLEKNYGRPTQYQAPRQVSFALRYSF